MSRKDQYGLIVGVNYTEEEVKRPIKSKVVVEKVENIPGSNAGAGSGDFLQYRNFKRREEARLELMEKEYRDNQIKSEFEQLRKLNQETEELKTQKKSLKRQKKKHKKQAFKKFKKESQKYNQYSSDGLFSEKAKNN